MSQSRKQMPPLLPPKKRGKNDTFDFLRKSTTTTSPSTLNQPKPKNDSPSATALNNPSQGAGSSQPFIGPQSVAPIKPSNSRAHPPRARAYRPTHRSPKAVAQAEPTRSAPPPQERTYLREKASSKPSSTATARPPRPVHPSHDDKTKNEPSKSATPRPRPLLMNPNMFMAGKLAQEYLMKGTLFGQPYVPTEADFPPAPSSPRSSHDGKTNEPSESTSDVDKEKEKEKKTNKGKAIELEANPEPKSNELDQQQRVNNLRYADVSKKLMSHGMHLPGVVNPSQLYEFLNRHPEVE